MRKEIQLSEWEKQITAYIKRHLNTPNLFVCSLAHVSKSGMQREVKIGLVHKSQFADITYIVNKFAGQKLGKNGGVVMRGCGMDMIFACLDNFAASLGVEYPHKFNAVQHYRLF